jgi:vacuolar protein sorting-associated protein 35
VDALFELLKELIQDSEGQPLLDTVDEEDFEEEQNLVARLLHMLVNDDPEQMFLILTTARKHFVQGGPRRLQYTLPPLIFTVLKLVHSLQAQDLPEEGEGSGSVSLKKVFQFLHQVYSHFCVSCRQWCILGFTILLVQTCDVCPSASFPYGILNDIQLPRLE